MPPPMLRIYLVSIFAAGALGRHVQDGLEPHSRLVLMGVTTCHAGTW